MNATLIIGSGAILAICSVVACDRSGTVDGRTGQTTTTSASDEAARKAEAVGQKVGDAAKNAAGGAQEELKKEWNNLDVHVETSGSASDAGAPAPRNLHGR